MLVMHLTPTQGFNPDRTKDFQEDSTFSCNFPVMINTQT